MMMSYEEIGAALIQSGRTTKTELTPICVDTADNVYRGKPWEVDPQEFVNIGR